MNSNEIKKQIIEMILEVSPDIQAADLPDMKSLIEDFGFDSLMLIEFISELERKFEFSFDIDDDLNQLVNDIDKLAEFIFNKRGEK